MSGVRIFLDDERFPPDDGKEWVIIRNRFYFDELVGETLDKIDFISFDHDLGSEDPYSSGYACANYLISMDLVDGNLLSDTFSFYVHSQNPVGAENIRGLLNNYLEFKKNGIQRG